MSKNIQAIRGMNDILPEQTPYWQKLEQCVQQVVQTYGYSEIRFPIVEQASLFKRTIGQGTDIVEKEMYAFNDLNGDALALRPEGTAGCVRAGIERGLLYNQLQRLWYVGPMFRHERPQKGRYRQFHQFGVEAFGMSGPEIDVEQILMMQRIFQQLGIDKHIVLQINSLGSAHSRTHYREELVKYFKKHHASLDEDSQRRLHTNPLRILDSKNPAMQQMIADAPHLTDYLDDESRAHFDGFKKILDTVGIKYIVNPKLVRGLDYYCLTVYEWVTDQLGSQAAVCAGGRYDGLVELLGGKPTPAVGFALGLERTVALLEAVTAVTFVPDIYVVTLGAEATTAGLLLAEKIRFELQNTTVITDCAGGGLKNQLKRADKSGAKLALIIGEQELADQKVMIKFLREDKQMTVSMNGVLPILALP